MRILGINGWPGASHDAAACLTVDGEVVTFAEEERFTRRKHAFGAGPVHSAAFCLGDAGLTLDDIDVVAHGWHVPNLFRDRSIPWPGSDAEVLEMLLPRDHLPRSRDPQLTFVNHHLAHAASAFHLSGRPDAAILVLDGQGENESTTMAVGRHGKIEKLHSAPPSWSLGYFYDAVCRFAGLGTATAGKLMGLAPYGTPGDYLDRLLVPGDGFYSVPGLSPELRSVGRTDEEEDTTRWWLQRLAEVAPLPANSSGLRYDRDVAAMRKVSERDPFDYRDLAATAQDVLERCVVESTRELLRQTGARTLVVAGGVGFNATLNGKLSRLPEVDDLFVQPLAGDQGVALGAAVQIAVESGDAIAPMAGSVAWGPQYSPDIVRATLDRVGLRYVEAGDRLPQRVAELLDTGAVIGWHQGRGEGGPRALGQRSMLTLPTPAAKQDHINLRIKTREKWRPFAPSILDEEAPRVLGAQLSLPYMIVTSPVQPDLQEALAATVHVDGTTRPQTVSHTTNPLYHSLLSGVRERTGLGVVLNTSFNGRDEPVVNTPSEAISTFLSSPLDALAIGPFLVRKDGAS